MKTSCFKRSCVVFSEQMHMASFSEMVGYVYSSLSVHAILILLVICNNIAIQLDSCFPYAEVLDAYLKTAP